MLVLVAGVLVAGCGRGDAASAGDEPITAAAIAAIAQEHVDLEPRKVVESYALARELGDDSPGAWLQYGDLSLRVDVAPTSDSSLLCDVPDSFDGCVDDSVDGHDVRTSSWSCTDRPSPTTRATSTSGCRWRTSPPS